MLQVAATRSQAAMSDIPDIHIQVRILPILGPGKIQLLEAIDRHGSIASAARSMGMAYANAWKRLDALNRYFKAPLVTRNTGGQGGGGAVLTETGRAVLDIYRSLETKARIMFAGDMDALKHLLAPQPSENVPCEGMDIGSAACRRKKRKLEPG